MVGVMILGLLSELAFAKSVLSGLQNIPPRIKYFENEINFNEKGKKLFKFKSH